ncbi:MAG: FtsX-like permease family protein [bacterium]
MDKLFILEFAFRNLKLHRARAILTLAGVIIGVSAIVFLLSFALGIQRLVTNEVTHGDAFTLIDVGTGNSQIITLNDATADNIKAISGVKNVYGMTTVGATAKIADKSMDTSFFGTSSDFLEKSGVKTTKGTGLSGKDNEILVNSSYLNFYNASIKGDIIGQTVNFDIIIPKELIGQNDNLTVFNQPFIVIGIINDDSSPKVYADFSNLKALGVASYTQFKVESSSQNQVSEIRKQIENMGLKTQYVGDTVSQINQVFGIFQTILGSFGLITLIVAILGMFNTLTISLLERIKEIALMKMLGMRKKEIQNIFLTESILLGFSGGLVGLFLGLVAGQLAGFILNHYAQSLGGQTVSVFYLPASYIFIILLASLLVGFLTGIYPASRAVKVKSLDILRYE